MSSTTAASGSSVTISDSAPTSDPYNLTIVEIVAASVNSQITHVATPAITTAKTANQTGSAVSATASAASPVLSIITTGEAGDACSPGGLATLLGSGWTGGQSAKATPPTLPTKLSGVQVFVNGMAAPLLFASDTQINFQCPVLPQGTAMQIQVESSNGAATTPLQTLMQPVVPVLFKLDATGRGLVTIAGTDRDCDGDHGRNSEPARQCRAST